MKIFTKVLDKAKGFLQKKDEKSPSQEEIDSLPTITLEETSNDDKQMSFQAKEEKWYFDGV